VAGGACLPRTQDRAGDKASSPLVFFQSTGAFWCLFPGIGRGVHPGKDAQGEESSSELSEGTQVSGTGQSSV
jgi:hypothetical protein